MYIKNYKILLSRDNRENFIFQKNKRFSIRNFDLANNRSNSSVFLLNDNEKEYPQRIIKFCNYSIETDHIRYKRFLREIQALKIAKDSNCKYVIDIDEEFIGQKNIEGYNYKYYVMELGRSTLSGYLNNNELDISEKLRICVELIESIKEFRNLGLYHRDLKPENILFVKDTWKICDLGLIHGVAEDFAENFDEEGEKIGPFGWFSPEAMNKFFCEGKNNLVEEFDYIIDFQSDVFQMGKIFWYIFQRNIPEGQIILDDFILNKEIKGFFEIIFAMLQYQKTRRINLTQLEASIQPIRKNLVA